MCPTYITDFIRKLVMKNIKIEIENLKVETFGRININKQS